MWDSINYQDLRLNFDEETHEPSSTRPRDRIGEKPLALRRSLKASSPVCGCGRAGHDARRRSGSRQPALPPTAGRAGLRRDLCKAAGFRRARRGVPQGARCGYPAGHGPLHRPALRPPARPGETPAHGSPPAPASNRPPVAKRCGDATFSRRVPQPWLSPRRPFGNLGASASSGFHASAARRRSARSEPKCAQDTGRHQLISLLAFMWTPSLVRTFFPG